MPAKKLEEVTNADTYKKILKVDVEHAAKRAQPFRLYQKFKYANKVAPLVVVGVWDNKLLEAIKANSGGLKATGRVCGEKENFEYEVASGGASSGDVGTALSASGYSGIKAVAVTKLTITEDVIGAALDDAEGETGKEVANRQKSLKDRVSKLSKGLFTKEEVESLRKASEDLKVSSKDDSFGAMDIIAKAEKILDDVETRNGRLSGSPGQGEGLQKAYSNYTGLQEEANRRVDDKIRQELPKPKPLKDSTPLGDTNFGDVRKKLEEQMKGRGEAVEWQEKEIEGIQEASGLVARQKELEATVRRFTQQGEGAKKGMDVLEKANLELAKKPGSEKQIEANNLKIAEFRQRIIEAQKGLGQAVKDKQIVDKQVEDTDAELISDKHGSGRHGAQTGISAQARRVATGGFGGDQPGNESGVSRPMVDSSGQALKKIQFNKVTIQYEEVDGKRVIKDKDRVLKEIVIQSETHFTSTIRSSLFLGPEFEKEAVTRALDIVKNQCHWKQTFSTKEGWKDLLSVTVTLGKPSKGIGWGTGVERRDTAAQKTLLEANKILEDFRTGKIDQNKMLDELGAQMVMQADKEGQKGGVAMVPTCVVLVDRSGPDKPWVNRSQYPCAGAKPGWTLEGKKVRKDSGSVGEETAPACSGV